MHEKRLQTKYGTIFYWCSTPWKTNRQTLFFLHGMTADHTMFHAQYDFFQKDYNLIAWDAPAHGKSRPFQRFDYDLVAESIQTLFKAEQIEHAVFIGQSMGGFLTQAVIKRYPELVSAFVSIDSCPYGLDYYAKSDLWWLRQIQWMSGLFPLKLLKKSIAKQNTTTKTGYDNMAAMLQPYGKKELCHLMGLGYAGFLEDNMDLQLTCPTLLLVGERDQTGKVKRYNQHWHKATGFPLVWVKDAAHNANVDQPRQVNKAMSAFFRTLW